MKTIIAGTDFSKDSLNAVFYAADIAVRLQARLLLYHAVENTAVVSETAIVDLDDSFQAESLTALEKLKGEIIRYISNGADVHTSLRYGTVRNELEKLCCDEKPVLIVMACSKKSPFERLLAGSNTLSVSRHCLAPLLLIPKGITYTKLEKIAIAMELDHACDSLLLEKLTKWLPHFNTAIEIVNVAKPNGIHGTHAAEAVAVQKHLSALHPTFHCIINSSVEAGIAQYVQEYAPDVLIIIRRKHGWLHTGSHSKPFILHPSLPIIVFSASC